MYLNLYNNSLSTLDGFEALKHLKWLNVSGNQLKSLSTLSKNLQLEFIDASNNLIHDVDDLYDLFGLKSLNLNGNLLRSLRSAQTNLPRGIENFFIDENEIEDLGELSYLSSFERLGNLSIKNNPCLVSSLIKTLEFN